MFRIKIIPHKLLFKRPAGTSRGIYTEHRVWYVVFQDTTDETHFGIGECAPLHDLSVDYSMDYVDRLSGFCRATEEQQKIDSELLRCFPSILFGLETAMRHYQQQSWQLWDSPFARGEEGITINGLVWMGDHHFMLSQIENLLERGFSCIKLKIGAIDFERELDLLRVIRQHYTSNEIILRVDANGNFENGEAREKLLRLAEFDIHSIEQPIRTGQWKMMAELCASSPLPIALDEELIGIHQLEDKRILLQTIRPHFIILKPTLHGGISGCEEWIGLADEMGIGWWITSALESNIGLHCIAKWCATLNNPLPQGLGTGSLYTNNIPMPLHIGGGNTDKNNWNDKGDKLWIDPQGCFPDRLSIESLK